jgi:hypothetical protein
MYQCEICGRKINKKLKASGYVLCSKHYKQYHKYHNFLDNNPRTIYDLNDYKVYNGIAEFNIYNQKNEYVGSFIIDEDDIQKVKYKKWRKDSFGHIVTGNCSNTRPRQELSRLIMNVTDENLVVDHIDCDTTNNRKSNLRICKQTENTFNKSFMSNNVSGIIGVCWDKYRNRWTPEIQYKETRVHLGRYIKFEEAVYVRHIAEMMLFEEYRNQEKDEYKETLFNLIDEERKKELEEYTKNKIDAKYNLGSKLC